MPVDPLSIESQSRDGSLVAYDKGKGNDKSPKRPARAVKHKEAMPAAGFLFEIASSPRRAKKVFFEFEDLQATAGQRGRGGVKSKAKRTRPLPHVNLPPCIQPPNICQREGELMTTVAPFSFFFLFFLTSRSRFDEPNDE